MSDINLNETKLYKKNLSIHKNLWKVYSAAIVISLVFIAIKGFV